MIASYHSHSRWCRHGQGELEEYIQEGIKKGLTEMAICEHIPIEGSSAPRMDWAEIEEYDAEVERLIEKYGKKIKLIKAFEAEYFPEAMPRYQKLYQEKGYGLWILGQHESSDHQLDFYLLDDPYAGLKRYTEDVIAGIETDFFDLLAHPDLIMVSMPEADEEVMRCMKQIFLTCKAHQVAVEINANGLRRDKLSYPHPKIWQMAKELELDVVISPDAHQPSHLVDEAIERAENMAKELGIEVMETVNWAARRRKRCGNNV